MGEVSSAGRSPSRPLRMTRHKALAVTRKATADSNQNANVIIGVTSGKAQKYIESMARQDPTASLEPGRGLVRGCPGPALPGRGRSRMDEAGHRLDMGGLGIEVEEAQAF